MRFWWFLVTLAVLVLVARGEARVPAEVCSNCHTMHNSVNAQPLNATGPFPALLVSNCVGCHSGTNTGTNTTPYVYSSNPTYSTSNGFGTDGNTLAGGNFYWVTLDDTKGHNVVGIVGEDQNLHLTPPGSTTGPMAQQLRCAGTYGCHGDPAYEDEVRSVLRAHHADDSVIDGTTVGTSYRFLLGVIGYEDPDWEYQPDSTNHNQYSGDDRTSASTSNPSTISSLCARCHGKFHTELTASGSMSSPWLRHPVDYDMSDTPADSEYRNYPGDLTSLGYSVGSYAPEVPLASVNPTAPLSTISFNQDAIITCITCHRAHGTPYPKLLRWDYWGWPGNNKINGCNACHTTKN